MKKDGDNFKEVIERIQDTFQKAEHSVARAFKDLTERLVETQSEAKKRFDELLSLLTTKELVERLPLDEAKAKVAAVRQDFESKFEESTELLWEKLGLATKADVLDLTKKLSSLSKRLKELEAKRPATQRN
jgi:polyhydroxyalkanoate synthesis regulator phasin